MDSGVAIECSAFSALVSLALHLQKTKIPKIQGKKQKNTGKKRKNNSPNLDLGEKRLVPGLARAPRRTGGFGSTIHLTCIVGHLSKCPTSTASPLLLCLQAICHCPPLGGHHGVGSTALCNVRCGATAVRSGESVAKEAHALLASI